MTPELTRLKEAAEKAIEVRRAFIETALLEGSIGHSMLFADGVGANTAYHNAATPELILSIVARVQELEEALGKIAGLRYVEDANEPFDEALDLADATIKTKPASEGNMTPEPTRLEDDFSKLRHRLLKALDDQDGDKLSGILFNNIDTILTALKTRPASDSLTRNPATGE